MEEVKEKEAKEKGFDAQKHTISDFNAKDGVSDIQSEVNPAYINPSHSNRDENLVDDNDSILNSFLKRKESVISSLTQISKLKFEDNPEKQEEVVRYVADALNQEASLYKAYAQYDKSSQEQ
uniref:Uncharacterized protein n=1 Tax=Strombidium rassoulzadegani TaxID=1082188 RepID=A0A7S3CMC5_9SPIT|mmetsp:Transcript_17123/g.28886  ORF Transcript_17123/g.28886 Transcript_17123/m.28886 type:complete len:122 (+) Transcript_17123:746-1111(+)